MEIKIFDVEHGFCAYIVADNGNMILVDCGHNELTNFRPSSFLTANHCSGIEELIVTNFDNDHLSDLPNLRQNLPVHSLRRNKSISADQLKELKRKSGGIMPGVASMIDMMSTYTSPLGSPIDFSGIEVKSFHNNYPNFDDTNNLSLVTFLNYRDIRVVFPGDLEKAGWEALLMNDAFKEYLRGVNIFIASHHGRESGYCKDVFKYCKPVIVIISDEEIKYDTQEEIDYSNHASGIPWNGGHRYVFTTRKDGMIRIWQNADDSAMIDTIPSGAYERTR